MGTFRNRQFLFLATILCLFGGLQHISRDKHLSSGSPFCLTSLKNGLPAEVFAANMETQAPEPTAATERSDNASPKKQTVHPEVPRIAADDLKEMLVKSANVVIVDANSADSYEMWHIPSAVNIPYISTADPMDRQLRLMALPLDKQIVIYCLCEEGADSAQMAIELKQLGYNEKNIKVLEGGLVLWDAAGHPMVKQKILE